MTEVMVERWIAASREEVYDAWTDAQELAQWWGPARSRIVACRVDARPGGEFAVDAQMADGSLSRLRCRYVELVRPERLVFRWTFLRAATGEPAPASTVTVTFEARDGGTLVRVRHSGLDPKASPNYERGWVDSLSALAARKKTL